MKKLESLNDSLFEKMKKNELSNLNHILGGIAAGTNAQDAATLKNLPGGCQQADVRKNDVTTDVGTVKCPPVPSGPVTFSSAMPNFGAFSAVASRPSYF